MPFNETLIDFLSGNELLSDAEALGQVQSIFRTVRGIALPELRIWMNKEGIQNRLERTRGNTVFTAVVTGMGADPVSTLDKFSDGLSFIFNAANFALDTTDPGVAQSTYQLLGLAQAIHGRDASVGLSGEEVTTFFSYSGGFVLGPGITADDITTHRTEIVRRKAAAEAETLRISQWNALNDNSAANWATAGAAYATAQNIRNDEESRINAGKAGGLIAPPDLATLTGR